ncbi:thiamine-phosphate synthase family protein [Halorientalis litorea]|uniref:thiamine-phosphate synthase family protein n=1 Tax=Halorientalis litorea TaxID=2931977 RepID=UPI001FF381CF|nr:thiamine-phosphate synthase family protein [Halorientalis litorea]
MKFVEEIVVDEFLPTFRSLLAEELRERGHTQSEVADLLGISQSAVSKYVHGDVARNERLLEDDRVRGLVARLGEGLTEGTMRPVQALVEAEIVIRQLEQGDVLAQMHQAEVPDLAEYGPFDVHDADSDVRVAEQVLASVRRGLAVVENAADFAGAIPAVGTNLVECLPDADGIEDVVAVPGRIIDVKGRPEIPAEPEFGMSEHVAGILLTAREHGSDARATLNLAYGPDIVAGFEDAGYSTVEFDAEADADAAIAAALADDPDADVLYQTGGFGIEAVAYVLGPDAPTVAGMARDALR